MATTKSYNSYSKNFDKDDDMVSSRSKNMKMADKAKDKKPKEKPLEKEETIRRLEREKKVVEKKRKVEIYEYSGRPKHPQFKEKRVKKDLAKSYYDGMFDEDDDFLG